MYAAGFVNCRIPVPPAAPYRGEVERRHVHELRGFYVPEGAPAFDAVPDRGLRRAAFFERLLGEGFAGVGCVIFVDHIFIRLSFRAINN
jgi:hypothetical protein